jgi:ABC-type amino acid transport substrate-binding protein
MTLPRPLTLVLLAALTSWAAISTPVANAAEVPLLIAITGTVASFSAPNERGELAGFNIDMAQAICQRLKRECRFDVRKFPEILPQVAAGKADIGMGNYLKTPERERQVQNAQAAIPGTHSAATSPLRH